MSDLTAAERIAAEAIEAGMAARLNEFAIAKGLINPGDSLPAELSRDDAADRAADAVAALSAAGWLVEPVQRDPGTSTAAMAARVREALTRTDLTQAQLAAKAGMSPGSMSKALNAWRRFSTLELALIAIAVDVNVSWLIWGDYIPPVSPAAPEAIR